MNVDKYINRHSLGISMRHLERSGIRNGILKSRQGGRVSVHDKSNIGYDTVHVKSYTYF